MSFAGREFVCSSGYGPFYRENKTHNEGLVEQCREDDNQAGIYRRILEDKATKWHEDFAMRKDVIDCHEQDF